ncbi:MAG: hypothetical protein LDLANPLL_02504 [Turneriella sp.]|nr:hypothetical protein [Turneriella sp.]
MDCPEPLALIRVPSSSSHYPRKTDFTVGSNYGPATRVPSDSPIGFLGLSLGIWFLILGWAFQSQSSVSAITRILIALLSAALPTLTLFYFMNKPNPYKEGIKALYEKNEAYFQNWDTKNLSKKELSSLFAESIRHREPKLGRHIAQHIKPFTFEDAIDNFVELSASTCQKEFFEIIKENNPTLLEGQKNTVEEILKTNCKDSNVAKEIQNLF